MARLRILPTQAPRSADRPRSRPGSQAARLATPAALSLGVLSVPVLWPAVLSLARAEGDELAPFPIDWRENEGSLIDLAPSLDAPAGRDGHLQIAGGHLATPDGRRFRIWGVNLTGAACFPEKEDAPAVAQHLARLGVNCVRFHFLDSDWGPDATVFDRSRDDTQALDARQADRLDFFVAELKRRGIYANFNLNVGRVYRSGDGVADHEYIGIGKGIQYYDDRVAELHRDYAKLLLTHPNPYTGSEYRHEPALAIVELLNENSLVEAWFSGRLRGRQTSKRPGTWSDITKRYADQLTAAYNRWLAGKLPAEELAALRRAAGVAEGDPVPRLEPESFAAAPKDRFHLEARFYEELEDAYFQTMRRWLRELGVRALVVATSDHNHYRTGYPLLASTSKLDLVDGHVYWQHPAYTREAPGGFRIPNTPMANEPLASTVICLARSAVAGKPYTVSETNHPFPNSYASEGIGILAAYALFQDWDGIFLYTFEHADPREWLSRTPGHFEIRADPVKMANFAAAGIFFRRGDLKPARRWIRRSYSPEQIVESIRAPASERPFFTRGFWPGIPLVHGTRIESFEREDESPDVRAPEPGAPIRSDTGELAWHLAGGRGCVTIDAERVQGAIGFVREHRPRLRHLEPRVENEFSSILLVSADGEPLESSRRMLLAATARAETTGMRWSDDRRSLLEWGRQPFRIEPVRGTLLLRGRQAGGPLEVTPLDGAGRPLGEASAVEPKSGAAAPASYEIPLGLPTTWYLVRPGGSVR